MQTVSVLGRNCVALQDYFRDNGMVVYLTDVICNESGELVVPYS